MPVQPLRPPAPCLIPLSNACLGPCQCVQTHSGDGDKAQLRAQLPLLDLMLWSPPTVVNPVPSYAVALCLVWSLLAGRRLRCRHLDACGLALHQSHLAVSLPSLGAVAVLCRPAFALVSLVCSVGVGVGAVINSEPDSTQKRQVKEVNSEPDSTHRRDRCSAR